MGDRLPVDAFTLAIADALENESVSVETLQWWLGGMDYALDLPGQERQGGSGPSPSPPPLANGSPPPGGPSTPPPAVTLGAPPGPPPGAPPGPPPGAPRGGLASGRPASRQQTQPTRKVSENVTDVMGKPTRPVEMERLHDRRVGSIGPFLQDCADTGGKLAKAIDRASGERKRGHESAKAKMAELRQLIGEGALTGGRLPEDVTARLKSIQNDLLNWFRQNPGTETESTSAGYSEMLSVFGVIREELLESELAAKGERQGMLLNGGPAIKGKDTSEKGVKVEQAVAGYGTQMSARPRDGAQVERALAGLLDAVNGLPVESPITREAERLKEAAEAELADIAAVKRAMSALRTPGPGWNAQTQEGVRTGDAVRGFNIESGTGIPGKDPLGKAGTAGAQAEQLFALLDKESGRSNIVAELVKDLVNNAHPTPLTMRLGDNSAGFFDNPATMGVDMKDLVSMPDDPVSVKTGESTNAKAGVTKSELLLHIIEERLVMQRTQNYESGHETCLSPNSLQNRFRREIGIDTDSLVFDCHDHDTCKDAKHHHDASDPSEGLAGTKADFVPLDSGGVRMTVPNLRFRKDTAPEKDHPRPEQGEVTFEHDPGGFDACKDTLWKKLLASLRNEVEHDKSFQLAWGNSPARDLLALMQKQYADDELKQEMQKIESTIKGEAERYKREFADTKRGWIADVQKKTEQAREHLNQPPEDPVNANGALKLFRDKRPRVELNDALGMKSKLEGRGYTMQHEENCGSCTLGAMFGKKSSEVVRLYLEKNGIRGTDLDTFSAVQDQSVFFRAKNNAFMTTVGARMPGGEIMPDDKSDVVGDAQFDGIREMLKSLADGRNDSSLLSEQDKRKLSEMGIALPKYKPVQDGVPDLPEKGGKLYPIDQLLGRMAKYPDGTQFQVFVRGPKMPGHWIYAEKYNKKVVIEDYQKSNSPARGGRTGGTSQTSYVGEVPYHPVTGEPAVFTQGMFIAVVPVADPSGPVPGVDAPFATDRFPQL